jgi:flagellar hook-associated protein 2
MGLSSPGIGSGIDVNTIVTQLMAVEKQPLTQLDTEEASYQSKVTAYGSLKGALASFQTAMQSLALASSFQSQAATVADPTVFTASASNAAAPGSYTVDVGLTAQSQVLASNGLASDLNPSSTGTLQISVGGATAQTITIDNTNNTLAGVRDAINAAHAGVTATVVSAGGATPYKLVLNANATGAANTITVTNGLAAGELHDAIASLAEVRGAGDATLKVNGVAVTSASNTVAGVIPGVTLNLLKTGSTTLAVAQDTAKVQSAINSFAQAYNQVNTTISNLTAYNATTKQGGPLLGDTTAQGLQTRIRATLGQALTGTGSSFTTLSQIGVSFQKDGSLTVDSTKLAAALTSNYSDIPALFALQGKSSNPLLSFVSAGTASLPGSYRVNITTPATAGAATASGAPAVSTTIDGTNDGLSVMIDGVASGALTLAHGTYTASQLTAAMQSAISGSAALTQAGASAKATLSGGKIVLSSTSFGAASNIANIAGTSLAALGFTGSESGAGTDVAGSFSLNGTNIAATGSGQLLTGVTGSAGADLKIQYTGNATQVAANPATTLDFSRGFAARLAQFATDMLDNAGAIAGKATGLQKSIADVDTRRTNLNSRLVDTEARYRKQFTTLDTMLSNLNQTSSFLTQQLASLNTTK